MGVTGEDQVNSILVHSVKQSQVGSVCHSEGDCRVGGAGDLGVVVAFQVCIVGSTKLNVRVQDGEAMTAMGQIDPATVFKARNEFSPGQLPCTLGYLGFPVHQVPMGALEHWTEVVVGTKHERTRAIQQSVKCEERGWNAIRGSQVIPCADHEVRLKIGQVA